jgi:hypothetical protein
VSRIQQGALTATEEDEEAAATVRNYLRMKKKDADPKPLADLLLR